MFRQQPLSTAGTYTKAQIKRAKEDFRVFLWIVWKEIGLPEPTEIQLDIAKNIQHFPSDRMILEGFRGVAKSFITCAFCVWSLWKDRNIKVEIISASKDRADANAVFIKRIMQVIPFLHDMQPDSAKGHRDTMNLFDVNGCKPDASPSVKSVGIYGQITGSRADLLISDDVEVPSNSGTQVQRDRLSEAVKEFDAILKPKGRIIYLGTPQCEMSLYEELTKRGYSTIIYPVEYPSTHSLLEQYGDRLAPLLRERCEKDFDTYAGTPTDPRRFDQEEIDKRRLSYGRAGYALQFLLNTSLSDAEKYPLKVQDLIIADLDPKEASIKWSWATGQQQRLHDIPCTALKGDYYYAPLSRSEETLPYKICVMAIDPSGRGKDETAYAVVKYLNGYLFLVELGGFEGGYSEGVLTALAVKAKYHGVSNIIVESNFGDGMYTELLKPVLTRMYPCGIEEVRSTTQKEARIIDTLEPVLMQHKLIVDTSVIKDDYRVYEKDQRKSLIYQMTRIHRQPHALAHDDRLDALSMAVAFYKESMAVSPEQGQEEYIDDMLELWTNPDGYLGWDRPRLSDKELMNTGRGASNYNMLEKYGLS
nr:MAG TPA: Terminase [Caudoviricetes sp.]